MDLLFVAVHLRCLMPSQNPSRDILIEILHDGAQRLLAQAIEAEVGDWIDRHADVGVEGTKARSRRGAEHAFPLAAAVICLSKSGRAVRRSFE